MSRTRSPGNTQKPLHYRAIKHQSVKYELAFQAASQADIIVSLDEFDNGRNTELYWIPSINDIVALFMIDLESWTPPQEISISEILLSRAIGGDNVAGTDLFLMAQIMAKPIHDIVKRTLNILAQDVTTTGLRRYARGFRQAAPKIFGTRASDVAISTLSGKETDNALQNFYNRTSFIEFSNTFESHRASSANQQSGWSVGLNSTGVSEYSDLQRRNLLFNSYDFNGLQTIFDYNFNEDESYTIRDYRDSQEIDVIVADMVQLRGELTAIPISTRYVMNIKEHEIASDYFFNFGGQEGYEIYDLPSTTMERIFGDKWNAMTKAIKENTNKNLVKEYKGLIKFELDRLACYRVIDDIMRMSQIMVSVNGFAFIMGKNGLDICNPGTRFQLDLSNSIGLVGSVARPNNPDSLEYIVNRLESKEFANGDTANRESNIYLVLMDKRIRQLFSKKNSGDDKESMASFYRDTEWLRMPDLVALADAEASKITPEAIKKLSAGQSKTQESIDIKSIPTLVSEELHTNINTYKIAYRKQLWLAGLANIGEV